MIHFISARSAPKPSDYGLNVTVCIAAMCESGRKIVAASDQMVTFGDFSADGVALKSDPIHRDWHVLFAGDDIGHVRPILSQVKYVLHTAYKNRQTRVDGEVRFVLEMAYQDRLNAEIEARVLKRNGFTAKTFARNGVKLLTAERYHHLCARIDKVDLGCVFLVAGFDPQGDGHIFSLDGGRLAKSRDEVGFWAIGSGAHPAVSSLAFHAHYHDFNQHSDLATCVYHVLEAKFMAQSNGFVGEKTFLAVFEFKQWNKYLLPFDIEKIRKRWKQSGAPRVPRGAKEYISEALMQLASQTSAD